MARIVGPPPSPTMSDDGWLMTCRADANKIEGLAFGIVPCDKYNHRGGEGSYSRSPPDGFPVGRLRFLPHHKPIWKKTPTLTTPTSGFRDWPVNE